MPGGINTTKPLEVERQGLCWFKLSTGFSPAGMFYGGVRGSAPARKSLGAAIELTPVTGDPPAFGFRDQGGWPAGVSISCTHRRVSGKRLSISIDTIAEFARAFKGDNFALS